MQTRVLVLVATFAVLAQGAPFTSKTTPRTNPRPGSRNTVRRTTTTTPAPEMKPPPAFTAINFMQQFGYLPRGSPDTEALFNPESQAVRDAIRLMQKFGGLAETGRLDNETLELMETPRCGVKDVARDDSETVQPLLLAARRRSKRFVKGSEGWRKRTITYFIANWTPKIGELEVSSEMEKAFETWAAYSRLNFVRINDPSADIIVAFGRGNHGDGYAFDGPGSILAHAFYPYEMASFGGDIHFDDDEKWKLKLDGPFDDGVDFLSVAVHELGHSLGLGHSPVHNSVMFPYFKGFNPNPPQLGEDDVLAMYHMYITRALEENFVSAPYVPHFVPDKREHEEKETNEVPEVPEVPDEDSSEEDGVTLATEATPTFHGDYETVDQHRSKFGPATPSLRPLLTTEVSEVAVRPSTARPPAVDPCQGSYDAITMLRGELFVFKGPLVWRLSQQGVVMSGYPVPIRQMFRHLPASLQRVDAVYERPVDGSIVVFAGPEFWVTDGDRLLENSPRPLSALGLPRNLRKIDAIMVWGKNQKTYIFSGDQYWRYDEYARQMEPGYPISTPERWRGIPTPLDTVMTDSQGMTYFFKDSLFWRFDNARVQADERYPLPAPQLWLGCPEEPFDVDY